MRLNALGLVAFEAVQNSDFEGIPGTGNILGAEDKVKFKQKNFFLCVH